MNIMNLDLHVLLILRDTVAQKSGRKITYSNKFDNNEIYENKQTSFFYQRNMELKFNTLALASLIIRPHFFYRHLRALSSAS